MSGQDAPPRSAADPQDPEPTEEATATTEPAGDAAPPPPWRSALRSGGVRTIILPISAGLGIINTRLILENFGTDAYAQYGLLVAVGALLPFADLGMGAAIVNTVGGSEQPARDDTVRKVLITSIRVLICSSLVMLAVDALITAAGWWPTIMGEGLLPGSGPIATALTLGVIAITLPIAFGQRVLTGLNKNHVTIAMLGLQTPLVLLSIVLIINFADSDGAYLAVIPYVAVFVISVAATAYAARLIRPQIGRALRDVPRVRSVRGGRVFDVAWPMLVQLVAVPLAMQTDRLVLSHVTDPGDLAQYNLGAQMYLPVWQVISAAGVALWPIFARARATGDRTSQSPYPIAAGFAGAAAVVCLAITLVSPWLADFASGGKITLPIGLLVAFSVLMICQGAKYPLGIYLTDAEGLRFQAFMIALMLPTNLVLSIVLANRIGPAGPVIGSAIGVFVFEFSANFLFVRHRLRRRVATA